MLRKTVNDLRRNAINRQFMTDSILSRNGKFPIREEKHSINSGATKTNTTDTVVNKAGTEQKTKFLIVIDNDLTERAQLIQLKSCNTTLSRQTMSSSHL
jgi:hypothetical protein